MHLKHSPVNYNACWRFLPCLARNRVSIAEYINETDWECRWKLNWISTKSRNRCLRTALHYASADINSLTGQKGSAREEQGKKLFSYYCFISVPLKTKFWFSFLTSHGHVVEVAFLSSLLHLIFSKYIFISCYYVSISTLFSCLPSFTSPFPPLFHIQVSVYIIFKIYFISCYYVSIAVLISCLASICLTVSSLYPGCYLKQPSISGSSRQFCCST